MILRGSRLVPVLLTLLAVWAGLAIFSPLHKHDLSAPSHCTLNHLEAQQAEGAVIAMPEFSLVLLGAPEIAAPESREGFIPDPKVPARAPPASL